MSQTKTKVLNSLTPEQEAMLPKYRQQWLEVGISTLPADKEKAERGIMRIYQDFGFKKPMVLWFSSPFIAILAMNLLSILAKNLQSGNATGTAPSARQLESQLRSQLRSQLESQLGSQLESQLGSQLGSQLWSQLESQLWSQLGSQLWSQLESQLGSQLWSQLESQLESQLGSQFGAAWGGQFGAYWIAYWSFMQDVLSLKGGEGLRGFRDLTESCNFFWTMDGIAVLTDRPSKIKRDDQGQLHADGEYAMEFRDGWGFGSWHGVRLPENLAKTRSEKWEAKWILTEKNAEIRRVLIQGIGYARMAKDLKAKKLDSWKEYELLRIDDADVEPVLLVKMTCPSTGLLHAHRVPPQINSAREAIKWCNWGIDKEEFLIEK